MDEDKKPSQNVGVSLGNGYAQLVVMLTVQKKAGRYSGLNSDRPGGSSVSFGASY